MQNNFPHVNHGTKLEPPRHKDTKIFPPWDRVAPAAQTRRKPRIFLRGGSHAIPGKIFLKISVSQYTFHKVVASSKNPNGKGWYSRGYLPHCDVIGAIQSLTFRLADSLPQYILRQLEEQLKMFPAGLRATQRRLEMEKWLDSGAGCCALRHPAAAEIVQNSLLFADGTRYRLLAWCVMPNHVHMLIEPLDELSVIARTLKSYTARQILALNDTLKLGIPEKKLWMEDVWDRFMRNERHLQTTIEYIHQNPVKAHLCAKPEDWQWSSAHTR